MFAQVQPCLLSQGFSPGLQRGGVDAGAGGQQDSRAAPWLPVVRPPRPLPLTFLWKYLCDAGLFITKLSRGAV